MKIFYKYYDEKIGASEDDVGIFITKKKEFPGKQFIITLEKIEHMRRYQKIIQRQLNKEEKTFEIDGKNYSFMLVNFLLLTTRLHRFNLVGDVLCLIDILDKLRPKDVVLYTFKSKTMRVFFKNYFEERKIRYELKEARNVLTTPLAVLSTYYFLKLLLKLVHTGRSPQSKEIVLKPLWRSQESDNIERTLRLETLNYESKINFFQLKNFLRPFKTKCFDGQLYTHSIVKNIFLCYMKRKRTLPKERVMLYKKINITENYVESICVVFKLYFLFISEGFFLAKQIVSKYESIWFHQEDDPVTEWVSILGQTNRIYSIQRELIHKNCLYNPYNKNYKIKYTFVFNDFSRNILVEKYLYPKNKVVNIGNIKFDKVTKSPKETKNIVFTSQDSSPELVDFFVRVAELTNNKKIKLYIKPHPRDDVSVIKQKIKNTSIGLLKGDIKKTLGLADCIITYYSTTGFEAIYNDIPLIIINSYKRLPPGIPFSKYFPYFESPEAVAKYLNDDKLRVFTMPREFKISHFKEQKLLELVSSR